MDGVPSVANYLAWLLPDTVIQVMEVNYSKNASNESNARNASDASNSSYARNASNTSN